MRAVQRQPISLLDSWPTPDTDAVHHALREELHRFDRKVVVLDKGFTGECLNVVYEPVTGAHVGPGTVALFFYGKEK